MARHIGAVLLAALVLSASPAGGECAWVLWEEKALSVIGRDAKETREWAIHGARQTQAECEEALSLEWKRKRDFYEGIPGQEVRSRPGYINITIKGTDQQAMQAFQFLCLPDTVDPRGPKGAK